MPADVLADLEKLWRRQRYEYLTGSRIICKTPGFLVYAHAVGTAAVTTTVALHDGESANEENIVDLTGVARGMSEYMPSMPTPFKRGLYAVLGTTTSSLTVVIITVKE